MNENFVQRNSINISSTLYHCTFYDDSRMNGPFRFYDYVKHSQPKTRKLLIDKIHISMVFSFRFGKLPHRILFDEPFFGHPRAYSFSLQFSMDISIPFLTNCPSVNYVKVLTTTSKCEGCNLVTFTRKANSIGTLHRFHSSSILWH